MGGRAATKIDAHIGARIKEAREEYGYTKPVLGKIVGVTFQQIIKYEDGRSRVAASTLYKIAKALGKPIAWFFEGIE
jgi:transcriptional regulator with XRE-family HTH domain